MHLLLDRERVADDTKSREQTEQNLKYRKDAKSAEKTDIANKFIQFKKYRNCHRNPQGKQRGNSCFLPFKTFASLRLEKSLNLFGICN
jgi:hypothetical protein